MKPPLFAESRAASIAIGVSLALGAFVVAMCLGGGW